MPLTTQRLQIRPTLKEALPTDGNRGNYSYTIASPTTTAKVTVLIRAKAFFIVRAHECPVPTPRQ
eukprot:3103938-Alexandrium_andersonii.AAC.1